jgi:protein TonB
MSNPNPPPIPPPAADPRRHPDAVVAERKSASPLLWLLVLVAVFAFAWYLYNQRGSVSSTPEPAAPPAVEIGDGQDAAAERERAADDARRDAEREREAAARRTPAEKSRVADRDATPTARVEPTYPPTAYRAREEGSVLVSAQVDASGAPVSVDVARRSGSRALDQAAVEAVRQWRFEPAMRDGKAVASTVEVPVTFRLDR